MQWNHDRSESVVENEKNIHPFKGHLVVPHICGKPLFEIGFYHVKMQT